jgi:hypothetical protein
MLEGRSGLQAGSLRYSRLETCATPESRLRGQSARIKQAIRRAERERINLHIRFTRHGRGVGAAQ